MFRQSLINWGKGLAALKKTLIQGDEQFSEDIQTQLNTLKNVSNTVYNIHKEKYDKIIPIQEQIKAEIKFSKLCALAEADYIKYALEVATKKENIEITDRNF